MTNSLSSSLVVHDDDQVTAISEQDFLARVAAFERNEAQEAARAKESMKRMLAQQSTKPKVKRRQCHRDNDHYNETDEDQDEDGRRPPLFTSASPTASQPPPVNAIYPFYELAGRGPPPLQDPYSRDSLLTNKRTERDSFYGFTPPYRPHVYSTANTNAPPPPPQDLTRGLPRGDYKSKLRSNPVVVGGYGAGMQHIITTSSPEDSAPAFSLQFGYPHPSYRHPHYQQHHDQYDSSPGSHPHTSARSKPRQAPLPVSPHIHSALAPPTTANQRERERGPTFRFDYDLRTNPATLRVSSRVNGGSFTIPTSTTTTTTQHQQRTPLNHVYTQHPIGATNHAFATPSNNNNNAHFTTTTKYHHINAHVRRPLNDHLRKSAAFTPPQQVKIPIRA